MIKVVSVIIMLHITIRVKPHLLKVHTSIDAHLLAPFVAKKDILSLHVHTDVRTTIILRIPFLLNYVSKLSKYGFLKGQDHLTWYTPNMVPNLALGWLSEVEKGYFFC